MNKILNLEKAVTLSKKLRDHDKKLVLVGGCFDILHLGHTYFLEAARKTGDFLMTLLESDQTVKRLKGEKRPFNSQKNRAKVLAALENVDAICLLPAMSTNKEYDNLVFRLKPAIIATTTGDMLRKHKERQAKSVDGKVVSIKKIKGHATSVLAKTLFEHFYL